MIRFGLNVITLYLLNTCHFAERSTSTLFPQNNFWEEFRNDDSRFDTGVPMPGETTPSFTFNYSRQNLQCLNTALDYVHNFGLCDGQDPQSYFLSKVNYFSCIGRCGTVPLYKNTGSKECSCDEVCIVYRDCCGDIDIACPSVHASALLKFPSDEQHHSVCSKSNFISVHSCGSNMPKEDENHASQVMDYMYRLLPLSYFERNNLLPFPLKTLKEMTDGFGLFSVADTATGLIYQRLEALLTCGEPRSTLYFLPVVIYLQCSESIPKIDKTNIAKILGWCKSAQVDAVQSRFHRSCQIIDVVTCRCGQDFEISDHIHNVCADFNMSLPRLSRRQSLFGSVMGPMFTIPAAPLGCILSFQGLEAFSEDNNLQISVSSIPKSYVLNSKQADTGENIRAIWDQQVKGTNGRFKSSENSEMARENADSGENNRGSNGKHSLADLDLANLMANEQSQDGGGPVKQEDLIHVVEISHTIERRLLCDSLRSHVTDCQILNCAHGAILSHGAPRDQFRGHRCIWPDLVVVRTHDPDRPAPICWCMQVQFFLDNLGIWEVRMISREKHECILVLASTDEDDEEPLQAYELGRTARQPDPHTQWTLSLEDFTERIRNLYQDTMQACYSNSQTEDTDVCFQYFDVETSTTSDVPCILIRDGDVSLLAQSSDGHVSSGPGLGFISTLIAVGKHVISLL